MLILLLKHFIENIQTWTTHKTPHHF